MQELEKILEEIDIKIEGSMGRKREGLLEAEGIIRKHMSGKDTDVRTNDSWIPVDERLPEEKVNQLTQDYYEYQVTAQFGNVKDVRHYKYGNGHWWNGPGIVDQYVVAWRENPDPYNPQSSNL